MKPVRLAGAVFTRTLLIGVCAVVLLVPWRASGHVIQQDEVMLIPGMVLGLSHTANNSLDEYRSTAQNPYYLQWNFGQDYEGGDPSGAFFTWWSYPDAPRYVDSRCTLSASLEALPAGMVLGLMHSMTGSNMNTTVFGCEPWRDPNPTTIGITRMDGGDRGARSGVGYYWYTTTSVTAPYSVSAEYWDYLERALPRYTVFGLCHSVNQRETAFHWRGRVFNACDRAQGIPVGFVRVAGGDLEADAGEGYYWFEKITGPELLNKYRGGAYIGTDPNIVLPQSSRRLTCAGYNPSGYPVVDSLYLAGFCGSYVDRNRFVPLDNIDVVQRP